MEIGTWSKGGKKDATVPVIRIPLRSPLLDHLAGGRVVLHDVVGRTYKCHSLSATMNTLSPLSWEVQSR